MFSLRHILVIWIFMLARNCVSTWCILKKALQCCCNSGHLPDALRGFPTTLHKCYKWVIAICFSCCALLCPSLPHQHQAARLEYDTSLHGVAGSCSWCCLPQCPCSWWSCCSRASSSCARLCACWAPSAGAKLTPSPTPASPGKGRIAGRCRGSLCRCLCTWRTSTLSSGPLSCARHGVLTKHVAFMYSWSSLDQRHSCSMAIVYPNVMSDQALPRDSCPCPWPSKIGAACTVFNRGVLKFLTPSFTHCFPSR